MPGEDAGAFHGHRTGVDQPLLFVGNAIYPLSMMPASLQIISKANPLTCEVDALRAMMLGGGTSVCGLGADFAFLVAATAGSVLIAGTPYPRVVV